MNPDRYSQIRDLFLAAEEVEPSKQREFVRQESGDDDELYNEVISLLGEHDPTSARVEGEAVLPIPKLRMPPPTGDSTKSPLSQTSNQPSEVSGDASFKHVGESIEDATDDSQRHVMKGDPKQTVSSSEITQRGAERTHAAPHDAETWRSHENSSPSQLLFEQKSRRTRRLNSWVLLLAAMLPTALVGWWTYSSVAGSVMGTLQNELTSVAQSASLSANQFMDDKAQLVESWSRQESVRQAVSELVALADTPDSVPALRESKASGEILGQLQNLSGIESIKFVVWDRSLMTVASWQDDRGDIGFSVAPEGTANVARALRGETVFFGPERLDHQTEGFTPETDAPVMATIVPIRDDSGKVIAAMLVRGIGLYEQFNSLFVETSSATGLDVYAVNRDGILVCESENAVSLFKQNKLDFPPGKLVDGLRVSDPGQPISSRNMASIVRRALPLTESASSATLGRSETRLQQYNNYAGLSVVGAWNWNPRWRFGVIVEKDVVQAFAPARIVWYSFMTLGTLLTITALAAARRLSRRSIADQAAVHPLSRYDIVSQLGSGGMGVVYRARHRQLGRDTALKLLRDDRHSREDQLRFDREARLAASLSNPHSVCIYDYGRSEDGEAFCVMEYLNGLTLQEVVARSGSQSIGRVLFIMRQICEALQEAHELDLVHRDIKPQNIMLSLDGSVGDWAVVFDFGLAKPLSPDSDSYQTREVIWAGTPMYMAPERFRNPGVIDPRSDIYSVGCVGYYLLAGRPPFSECDPESLFALILTEYPIGISVHRSERVPKEISRLILKCMAKTVEERFANIAEMADEIDQLRRDFPWSTEDANGWWDQHGESKDAS